MVNIIWDDDGSISLQERDADDRILWRKEFGNYASAKRAYDRATSPETIAEIAAQQLEEESCKVIAELRLYLSTHVDGPSFAALVKEIGERPYWSNLVEPKGTRTLYNIAMICAQEHREFWAKIYATAQVDE